MRRKFLLAALLTLPLLLLPTMASAGNPHFVGDPVVTNQIGTLTVIGKEAGLGDEDQVHIVVTAAALCINGGENHPQAVNKADVTVAGDFPVQNGQAEFSISTTAAFSPSCSPPMTVEYTNVTVEDTTNGVLAFFAGPF